MTQGTEASWLVCTAISQSVTQSTEASQPECIIICQFATQSTEASQLEYITICRLVTQGTEASWLECTASVGDSMYRRQLAGEYSNKLVSITRYRGQSTGVYSDT